MLRQVHLGSVLYCQSPVFKQGLGHVPRVSVLLRPLLERGGGSVITRLQTPFGDHLLERRRDHWFQLGATGFAPGRVATSYHPYILISSISLVEMSFIDATANSAHSILGSSLFSSISLCQSRIEFLSKMKWPKRMPSSTFAQAIPKEIQCFVHTGAVQRSSVSGINCIRGEK